MFHRTQYVHKISSSGKGLLKEGNETRYDYSKINVA